MTIWYDFTTTIRNTGRSGIANVEWSIGQALLAADPTIRCFELAGRRGLVELDPTTRLQDAVYASSGPVQHAVINAVPTWRDDLRHGLRRRFGVRADPIIRSISAIYQMPNQFRNVGAPGWKRRPDRRDATPIDTLVGPGDVVVSMGADWDGGLARRLGELKRRTGCAVITMVYDLVPLTHTHLAFHNDPGLFERYYSALIEVSDLITCISNQSRHDLIEFAASRRLQPTRAEVLVLGEATPSDEGSGKPRGDFYLCVGTIERRKNIELVYDALRVLESEGRALPNVIVAGAPGWGTTDLLIELEQQSTRASRAMVLLGSVDDDVLDHLYRTARALLFPSHFEGWGLPVREAAIRGCPVAVAETPAVREASSGYEAVTFLPSDDPGPWADYLRSPPGPAASAVVRPWSAVADELFGLARSVSGPRAEAGSGAAATCR